MARKVLFQILQENCETGKESKKDNLAKKTEKFHRKKMQKNALSDDFWLEYQCSAKYNTFVCSK